MCYDRFQNAPLWEKGSGWGHRHRGFNGNFDDRGTGLGSEPFETRRNDRWELMLGGWDKKVSRLMLSYAVF